MVLGGGTRACTRACARPAEPEEGRGRMPGGRPPSGPRLVDSLHGSRRAKRRLRAVLETIAGTRSVREVAASLGIGEAAFYKLRARTLEEALEGLEPRPVGRPPRASEAVDGETLAELERELGKTRRALARSRLREELAVGLSELEPTARKKGR